MPRVREVGLSDPKTGNTESVAIILLRSCRFPVPIRCKFDFHLHRDLPDFQALMRTVADGGGFEPPVPVKAHTLSRRAQSTTLSPIQTVTAAEVAEEGLY